MSSKNIQLQKYKHVALQSPKPQPQYAQMEHKIHQQYSPKTIPSQITRYYKGNAIYRHASEEEFKRYGTNTIYNGESGGMGTQQQYYGSSRKDNRDHNAIQSRGGYGALIQDQNNPTRSYIKDSTSNSSIEHSSNRRVSPQSSPAFFRSKPKTAKDYFGNSKINMNNFKILSKLGEGKFGKVYLVRQVHTGFIMALKVVEKKKILQNNFLEQFIRELKIQAFLNHPNIIDVYGFFHDDNNFYSLLELGCDGQLYSIIAQNKSLTEEATSFITKNLLEAVNCMHQNQILHRDIKPQNIVLIMGNVKLCDFGWAVNKIKKQELRSTFCGTPLYLSPELLKGQRYDEKVDLWAIGILAYQLLIGSSPFEINEQQDLLKILTEDIKFPKGKKISVEFQQFIQHILNKNPKQRLPSSQLLRLTFIRKYEQFETCEELC